MALEIPQSFIRLIDMTATEHPRFLPLEYYVTLNRAVSEALMPVLFYEADMARIMEQVRQRAIVRDRAS